MKCPLPMECEEKGRRMSQPWERGRVSQKLRAVALMLCKAGLEKVGSGRFSGTALVRRGAGHRFWDDQGPQTQTVHKTSGPLHSHGERLPEECKRLDSAGWLPVRLILRRIKGYGSSGQCGQ